MRSIQGPQIEAKSVGRQEIDVRKLAGEFDIRLVLTKVAKLNGSSLGEIQADCRINVPRIVTRWHASAAAVEVIGTGQVTVKDGGAPVFATPCKY